MNLNWKYLVISYILAFGIWGFLLKIISSELNWKTTIFYVWLGLSIVNIIFIFKDVRFSFSKFHLLASLAGIIAALGTMAFYKAISLAPGSIIIPLASQYILVTVLLCALFLKEPITIRIIVGIFCSMIAILFLSR